MYRTARPSRPAAWGLKKRLAAPFFLPMESGDLIELVYLSTATRTLGVTELRELLGKARRRNREIDVTGLLIHADGAFLQVLEGPAMAVDALYERIGSDPRHEHVATATRRAISERTFPTWRMGYEEPLASMRSALLGFVDVMRSGAGVPPASAEVTELVGSFRKLRSLSGSPPRMT